MKSLLLSDKLFTCLRSDNVTSRNSLSVTKNVSFFNSPLQKQQTIQYTTGSLLNGLSIYGLITPLTSYTINTEQLGAQTGSNSVTGQGFGNAVALSGDGNIMAVGGCGQGYFDQGEEWFPLPIQDYESAAIWIYKRVNNNWSLAQGPILNQGYGVSLSLSGSGNVLAIGSYGPNSVLIYVLTNGVWILAQTISNVYESYTSTIKVSLSGSGNTLVVANEYTSRYLVIYERSGNTWIRYRNVLSVSFNQDGSDTDINSPTCISYDGNTIATSNYAAYQNSGKTAIFIKNTDGDWVIQGSFIGTGEISDREGFSNALSADGNILVTGAIQGSGFDGKAFYYTRTGSTWSTGTELIVGGLGVSHFGSSVAITGDGRGISVGGYYDGGGVGAVWLFYKDESDYVYTSKLRGTDENAYALRGYACCMSNDGKTLAFTGQSYIDKGAVWVYIEPEILSDQVLPKINRLDYNDSYYSVVTSDKIETDTLIVKDSLSLFGAKPISQLTATQSVGSIIEVLQKYGFASTNNYWNSENLSLIGTNGSNPTPTFSAKQGYSTALSFNGETAVIGGISRNNLTFLGGIWIFIKIRGVWTQQAGPIWDNTLPGTDSQGFSVTISSNGNYVAYGGPSDDGEDVGKGAAYVYHRTGNTWTAQSGPLIPPRADATTYIGRSVSISSAGDVLLVGANGPIVSSYVEGGNVWIYNRDGENWELVDGPIRPSDTLVKFGWASAISGDGLTFVVGDPEFSSTGAVWIYENTTPGTPGGWTKTAGPLISPTSMGNNSNQGISVCISGDGHTVAVGSSTDYNTRGSVYVYNKLDTTWSLQAGPLVGSASTSTSRQGSSVSISSDGNTLVVGGPGNNGNIGAVWTFKRSNGMWSQIGTQYSLSSNNPIKFGTSVSISANGENVLTGAPEVGSTGAVYPYVINSTFI
jgi:hypothetical protein